MDRPLSQNWSAVVPMFNLSSIKLYNCTNAVIAHGDLEKSHPCRGVWWIKTTAHVFRPLIKEIKALRKPEKHDRVNYSESKHVTGYHAVDHSYERSSQANGATIQKIKIEIKNTDWFFQCEKKCITPRKTSTKTKNQAVQTPKSLPPFLCFPSAGTEYRQVSEGSILKIWILPDREA